jgi:PD-(D/E)XK nuclease superfamily
LQFFVPEIAHETHEMTRSEEIPSLIHKEESYAIIGACMAAYKDKRCGFFEPVYHQSLTIEFELRGIPSVSKPLHTLQYRGRTLVQTFAPGFLGLLVNFGHYPRMEYERLLPRNQQPVDLLL